MANHEKSLSSDEQDDSRTDDDTLLPLGGTMDDVHRRNGSRPATPAELEEFEQQYGPFLPPDGEG